MPDGLSSLPRPLVLVVEDEAAIATMLRYNLEKQGYRVSEASDGQEALTRIQEQQPDIVLLDWMLPLDVRHRGLPANLPETGDSAICCGHHGNGAHRGSGCSARSEYRCG